MTKDGCLTDILVYPLLPVEFQVYPKDDLSDEQERHEWSETRMNVVRELSTFMSVAKKPTHD
jgi:hypothetical protein